MTLKNGLMDTRLWAVLDFTFAGWDIAFAFHHFVDGETLWGMIMLILGITLFVIGAALMTLLEPKV